MVACYEVRVVYYSLFPLLLSTRKTSRVESPGAPISRLHRYFSEQLRFQLNVLLKGGVLQEGVFFCGDRKTLVPTALATHHEAV